MVSLFKLVIINFLKQSGITTLSFPHTYMSLSNLFGIAEIINMPSPKFQHYIADCDPAGIHDEHQDIDAHAHRRCASRGTRGESGRRRHWQGAGGRCLEKPTLEGRPVADLPHACNEIATEQRKAR